jgi:hypothetical protein
MSIAAWVLESAARNLRSARMAKRNEIHAILADAPNHLGPGRAFDAAMCVLENPRLVRQLVECLWDEDEGVAGRAADTLETVAAESPRIIARWKDSLLGRLVEGGPIKLRWHLALTMAGVRLTRPECRRVYGVLRGWLDHRSSIVKTCAMQGVAELTRQDSSLTDEVFDLLRALSRSGTPAMRARGRILLEQLEMGKDLTWVRTKQQARKAARLVNWPHKGSHVGCHG